jgi:hypothetical protein
MPVHVANGRAVADNFQAEFYGVFSSNHAELAPPFFDVILKALPHGRRRAAYPHWGDRGAGHSAPAGLTLSEFNPLPANRFDGRAFGNYSGIELPSHVSAYGGYYLGDLGTRGIVGWVLIPFIDRVDYMHDMAFLKGTTYPLLLEAAAFFESYLTYDENAKMFTLETACALEGCTLPQNKAGNGKPQTDVTMTLGWIRSTFKALVRYSALLKVDVTRRPRWQQILDELTPFPTKVSGLYPPHNNGTVFDECKDSGDFGGNARYPVVYFGQIHPAAAVTRHSTPELMQTARNTVEQINQLNHWIPENGLCMGWPPAAVVSDNASATSASMDEVCRTALSPNFVPQIHGGCVSEQAGATQGINDLLLQSYDGVLSLYPAGGIGGAADSSSFHSLRARGAFLVSAAWDGVRGGVADGVQIRSEAGNECVLERPWGGGLELLRAADNSSVLFTPSTRCARCVSFATEAGASYLASRAPRAR